MKYKVLIPEWISESGVNYLTENDCECIFLDDCSVENVCKYVGDCDAILARNSTFNADVFEVGKKLKIIARHGVGVEKIDVEAAKKNNVKVTITPGSNSNSVAEHTIALIMACAKDLVFFDKITREGDWVLRDSKKTVDVSGKVLGLIGYGRISQLVAKKAALGLDMKVIVYRSHRDEKLPEYITEVDNMDDIFVQSDFVSFHAPLRRDTENVVNKRTLSLMKPTAYFINTARGGSVNEQDLYDSLKNKQIAGAAIDVFADEPPKADNPLMSLDNIILSPHNAAHSVDSMDRMAYNAATEIVRVLNGEEPLWEV